MDSTGRNGYRPDMTGQMMPPGATRTADTQPESPFEEPEAAPELRQQRSDSLYSRSTPFWERIPVDEPEQGAGTPQSPPVLRGTEHLHATFWSHPEKITEGVIMRVEPMPFLECMKRFLTSRASWYLYGAIVLLVVVALIALNIFATVRIIRVEGNASFTAEQVIALSGLEPGMSTLGINEETVMARIGRERYLRCTLVDVTFDAVTLHVRERVPCVTIVQNGRRATLDERGWVLEITDDVNAPAPGLISVTGLDVHHCVLGQAVTLRLPVRLVTYTQILIELRAMGALHLISELDMTTMDSITMKTADGLTILLGNEEMIHQKLRAMLVVRDHLLAYDFYGERAGGTIVVSDPTSPAYRPPDVQ